MPTACLPALLLGAPALAADQDNSLPQAIADGCTAAMAGDRKAARSALDLAEDLVREQDGVVSPDTLGRIWLCRGVAVRETGGKESDKYDDWRQALAVAGDLAWDRTLAASDDEEVVFEVLRKEVTSQAVVQAGVPERTGAARVYIDGARADATTEVAADYRHLAQVSCPDETFHAVWFDGDSPRKWLELCPGGVDTTVVLAEDSGDDFGDMAPMFGGPAEPEVSPAATSRSPSGPAAPADDGKARRMGADLDERDSVAVHERDLPLHARAAVGYPTMLGLEWGFGQAERVRLGVDVHDYGLWIVGADLHLSWLPVRDQLGVEVFFGPAGFMEAPLDFDGDLYSNAGVRARWSALDSGVFALAGLGSIDGPTAAWWAPQAAVGWER